MKIILAAVSSLDGKITKGRDSDIRGWTSPEDTAHFAHLKSIHNLIVMGRKTYEAMRPNLQLDSKTLRVVLTKHPENFAAEAVSGQLEFSSESPVVLVGGLEKQGYSEMLLVGGGTLNGQFLAKGLVDEIYLTLEPRLFGTGTSLAADSRLNVNLRLLKTSRLNEQGTLLLHYKKALENQS